MSAAAAAAGPKNNKTECVKVVVRCRPLNSAEIEEKEEKIVTVDIKSGQIRVQPDSDRHEAKVYTFDHVYDESVRQVDIFNETAKPIVDSTLNGYNGTIFAYGQTGTGKTFTMEGAVEDPDLRGIMPNAFHHIFDSVGQASKAMEFLVRASFLEIYNDEVYDLLNKNERKKMEVRESKDKGVFVKDLSTYVVKSVPDLMKVLKKGQKSRRTGATKMNEGSSRSHSIFTITTESSITDAEGVNHYKVGKLNMVDLAGSERQKKTDAKGARLEEANNINLSLSALGLVIKALINPQATHIPFRDSKLTRLLQDSLGGNTKTVMIANIGPAKRNYDETMDTLRYANRAKDIKNRPTVNEDPKDAMLRQYQEEIAQLKAQLEAKRGGLGAGVTGIGSAGAPPGTIIEEVIRTVEVPDDSVSPEELKRMEDQAKQEQEQLKQMTDQARAAFLEAKTRAEQEKVSKEKELQMKQLQIEEEKKEMEHLEAMLRAKEQQIQVGGLAIDLAIQQQKELDQTEAQLEAQRNEQLKLKEMLGETEEEQVMINRQYQSRQEELQEKTRQLKTLFTMSQAKERELQELEEEFEVEREELINTIRGLDRQIKLKQLVLGRFVPEQYVALIESQAHFDEMSDSWLLPGLELAANNVPRAASAAGQRADALPARYLKLLGHTAKRGGPSGLFDPSMHGVAPEVQAALQAVASGHEVRSPPRNVYYTYGVESKGSKRKGKRKTKKSMQ